MHKVLSTVVAASLLLMAAPLWGGYAEGVEAFKAGNYGQAAKEFQSVIDQSPENYQGYYMLGLALERDKRGAEALANFRKAYDLNPNELSVKMALAKAYSGSNKFEEVRQLLGTVDANALPAQAKTAFYQMRARANTRVKDYRAASRDFKVLVGMKPNDSDLQYSYAAAAYASGQYDVGIAALEKAIKLDPGDVKKKSALVGWLLKRATSNLPKDTKKQHYARAAAVAKEVAASSPSFDNLLNQASAELGAGLYDQVARSATAAISKNGSDWRPYYYIGQAYTKLDRFDDAIGPLNDALGRTKAEKEKSSVYFQLGHVYEKKKDFAKAIESYEKAGKPNAVARVRANQETAQFNEQVEAENAKIREMEEEAKRLEEELKKLESGGGGR